MVKVMASGAFDIIHPGHIHYLEQAKSLGDELVVIIASDKTVERRKRKPVMDQEARLMVVKALKPVDQAVLGGDGDIFQTAMRIKPDIVALGYDQSFGEKELAQEFEIRGMQVKIVRLSPLEGSLNGSRKIIGRVKERYQGEVT
ncbi:MAG TPA: FAD synthase [Euryarchaeota archaeon]|nr:FAD synthase [Euryarchaeota archaeon]